MQHRSYAPGDFDCDTRYGGCRDRDGCERLPPVLQEACRWRYDWLHWMEKDGKTHNPWVVYRRVRCPKQLTDISGSVPVDDGLFEVADLELDTQEGRAAPTSGSIVVLRRRCLAMILASVALLYCIG